MQQLVSTGKQLPVMFSPQLETLKFHLAKQHGLSHGLEHGLSTDKCGCSVPIAATLDLERAIRLYKLESDALLDHMVDQGPEVSVTSVQDSTDDNEAGIKPDQHDERREQANECPKQHDESSELESPLPPPDNDFVGQDTIEKRDKEPKKHAAKRGKTLR